MTSEETIEQKLEKLVQTIAPDDILVEKVMNRINAESVTTPCGIKAQNIWRTIMKNRITKFAAAAVIIVMAILVITFLDKSVTPAYAIEQTIEAIKNVQFLHIIMKGDDDRIVDERWIEIGPDGFQTRYRQELDFMGMSLLIVDDGETCFVHDRNKNTVVLHDRKKKQYEWIGNLGQFFKDMAGESTLTIEENVDYKGERAHRVRWLKLNQDCYIDPKTKLPIAVGPHDVFYEEPPEETFAYVIPDGVELVDKRPGAPKTPEPEWMKQDETANEQFVRARRAFAAGKYTQALGLFAGVVKVQAAHNWAWFWLGRANYELGRYDASIEAFTQVIDLFSKFKVVPHYCHLARGFAYRAAGMENAAKRDFSVALPVMIDTLRNIEGARMFDDADNTRGFPDDKRPTAEESLTRMIERLREMTGEHFSYNPNASAEENEDAISAWEQWYRESAPDADQVQE